MAKLTPADAERILTFIETITETAGEVVREVEFLMPEDEYKRLQTALDNLWEMCR